MTVLTYNPALSAMSWLDATASDDWVLGIDCSRWQDDNSTPQRMDFDKAYAEGARFTFIKASQACWVDEDFIWNWKAAKDAGLYRGAYHYLDWSVSGLRQAEFFCGVIHQDPGELPPVLDFECRNGVSDALPNTQLALFTDYMDATTYKKSLIYTSPWFWREYGSLLNAYTDHPLWIANYEVLEPAVPAPWTDWTFWQYTDKGDGKLFGAESYGLDMNWYNGSWDDFVKQFGGDPVDPPDPGQTYEDGWNDCKDEVRKKLEAMK